MTQIEARKQAYAATVVAGCSAVLLAQVSYSMPSALNGTFQQEFQTAGSQLTWITAAFAVPMVVLALTAGAVGDRFGRRRLLQVGALLTLVGSLVTYSAGSVEVVWTGQVVAGVGAAILYPVSLAMLVAASPTPVLRARAIALWAGFLSIGAALAPSMAGRLADAGHWRTSYVVVVLAALVSMALTQRAADSPATRRRALDLPGQVTLALGLGAILWAVTQGSATELARPGIIGALVVGAALLVAFVVVELRTEEPLLNLSVFADRTYAVVAVATLVGMFAFLATSYTMSVWVGAIQHQGALRLGLLFVLIQAPALLLVPVVSHQIRRSSPRLVLTTGFALIAVSGIWCSTFGVQDLSWARFVAPMLLLGIGFALTLAAVTAVAVTPVPDRLVGRTSAATNLLRGLGFALAPVVVATFAGNRADDSLRAGLGEAIGASGLQPPYSQIAGGIAQQGGAMAVNALPVVPGANPDMPPVPMPPNLHVLALESLGSAYSTAFLAAGLCAAPAAALTLVGLASRRPATDAAAVTEDEVVAAD